MSKKANTFAPVRLRAIVVAIVNEKERKDGGGRRKRERGPAGVYISIGKWAGRLKDGRDMEGRKNALM